MTMHRTETVRKKHCSFSLLHKEREKSVFTVITDKMNKSNSIQKSLFRNSLSHSWSRNYPFKHHAFRTYISQFNPAHRAMPSLRSIVVFFSAVIHPSPLLSLSFRFPKCNISLTSHLSRVNYIFHPPHSIPLYLITVNVLKELFDLVTSMYCRDTLLQLNTDY